MGRPTIGKRAMTDAERQRRRREKLKEKPEAAARRPETPSPARRASPRPETAEQAAMVSLRQHNAALRREVEALSKLPVEVLPRYRAFCRRFKAQMKREANFVIASVKKRAEEAERRANARSGAIPAALWRDLMLSLHPDRAASDKVMARAFDGMRQREGVLRAK